MKTVLIVGGTGHIGKNLIMYLQHRGLKVKFTSRRLKEGDFYLDLSSDANFDFSSIDDVEYVIFTAANLNAETCEKNEKEVRSVNVTGTIKFISEVLKLKKKVVYLSSDIVYGFDEHRIFDESSAPCPASNYGIMKLEVENYFKANVNFRILRPSYVFSMEDKFALYCKKCEEDNTEVKIYHPYYRKFISVFEVCECIYQIIEKWQEYTFQILNVCGHEMVSKIRIVDEINRVYKKHIRYQVIRPDELYYRFRPAFLDINSLYLYSNGILQEKSFGQMMEQERKIRGMDIW